MDSKEARQLLYRMLNMRGVRLIYSPHAIERMFQRRFTMQDVVTALSGGAMVEGPTDNGREGEFECVMRLQVEGRALEVPVIICEDQNKIIIKSTVRTKLKLQSKMHKK